MSARNAPSVRLACLLAAALAVGGARPSGSRAAPGAGAHPHWRDAYVFSFRSPDLLTDEPDERWGREDARLVAGGLLRDLPRWLRCHGPLVEEALREGRPVLLSLHLHSGWGTGLVTYSEDLRTAEAASYPWLVRALLEAGMGDAGVTVAVDTCNAQGTAAHQLRPDLVRAGVEAWAPFRTWRHAAPARGELALDQAYPLFTRDRVAAHLAGPGRGRRAAVKAAPFRRLEAAERRRFRARLFGPRGVILGTPAFFNLLRVGPDAPGTLTADLLADRLDVRVVNGWKSRNLAEFRLFRDFAFLASAGSGPGLAGEQPEPGAPPRARRTDLRD